MKKSDLDRDVALDLDEEYETISLTTLLFLRKLMESVAAGEEVNLAGFGKFRLVEWAPSARLHGNEVVNGPCFRVSFIKARTFQRFIKAHKEKQHGKVGRGRVSRPGSVRKSSL